MYRGIQAVAKKICNTFYLFMNLKNSTLCKYSIIQPSVSTYLDKCLTGYAEFKQHTLFDGCSVVGSPCIRVLTLFELYSVQELLN